MVDRTITQQMTVEASHKMQREYVDLRSDGATHEEACAMMGIAETSSYSYVYEVYAQDPALVEEWWTQWEENHPLAEPVPRKAASFIAQQNKIKRHAAALQREVPSNAGQAGPVPKFTPDQVPARASLATIDNLRVDLARWRGKAKAAYNLITDEEFVTTLDAFLENAIAVVEMLRKIQDLLDIEDKEDE